MLKVLEDNAFSVYQSDLREKGVKECMPEGGKKLFKRKSFMKKTPLFCIKHKYFR